MLIGLLALSSAACDPPDTPVPPVMTLKIWDVESSVHEQFFKNWTRALSVSDLAPVSEDPVDTMHTVWFDQPLSAPAPVRQEVVLFDLDWTQPLTNPIPSQDYKPVPNANFISVVADEMTNTNQFFGDGVTAHAVRYWHGQCSFRQPWEPVFEGIASGIMDGFADQGLPWGALSVTREYMAMQPNFIGYSTNIEHGFVLESYFEIGTLLGDIYFEANPAYTFDVTSNGLVSVHNQHQGVVIVSDVANLKPTVQSALQNEIADEIAARINDELTFPLELPGLGCNPADSPSQQKEMCHQVISDFGVPIIEDALVSAGYSPGDAANKAKGAVNGLTADNFTCDEALSVCAFHPIVQRVNVLPDELEFVFAGEPAYSLPLERDRVTLYEILPDLIGQLEGGATLPPLCHEPMGRDDGVIPLFQLGEAQVL